VATPDRNSETPAGTQTSAVTRDMIRFSPHPVGKTFAMTFIDDTDLSTRANTEPVYELLAHHHFWGTKTVWPLRAKRNSAFRRDLERETPQPDAGDTLQDADYLEFIKILQTRGFEIALHGVAAGNSRRDEIESGLALFRSTLGVPPSLNVFHQTNLENIYCGRHKLDSRLFRALEFILDRSEYEGHRPGTASYWADIIASFRYVRLPFHTIDEIDTLSVCPSMPFHDLRRPLVQRWFAASDGADVVRFTRLLSAENVSRLARQQGVCIVYTHFAKGFARRRAGSYALDTEFERTVERVASHSGSWFATVTEVLDRLAAMRALSMRHDGRRIEITNHGEATAHSIVMHVSPDMTVTGTDGTHLDTAKGLVVLPSLRSGETLTLETNRSGAQTIAPGSVNISRRDHRRIEYRNYLGLLRGRHRDKKFYARRSHGSPRLDSASERV
jgi:hypothetical protein